MKKYVILLTLFFLPFTAGATTIYQQFTDNAGEAELNAGCLPLGSFTVSAPITVVPFSVQSVIRNNSIFTGSNLFNYVISTSSSNCNAPNQLISVTSTRQDGSFVPNDNAAHFSLGTTTTPTSYTTFLPNTIYYIWADSGITDVFITTNLSGDFLYGYITAGGFAPSLPILPGLLGYTDVGISTTSQQVYCNQNFSTSTGLLDSVGQSISLGLCNVSVFLFIPSQSAVSTFMTGVSQLENKAPFAWAFEVRDIYNNYVATTSTSTFPILSIDVGTSSLASVLGTSQLTLLSQNTVNTYLPNGVLVALRLLISGALWLGALSFVFGQINNVWHKNVS